MVLRYLSLIIVIVAPTSFSKKYEPQIRQFCLLAYQPTWKITSFFFLFYKIDIIVQLFVVPSNEAKTKRLQLLNQLNSARRLTEIFSRNSMWTAAGNVQILGTMATSWWWWILPHTSHTKAIFSSTIYPNVTQAYVVQWK